MSDLKPGSDGQPRCGWCVGDSVYEHYHDNEWAIEQRDGASLFEKLALESMQAGLSWLIVLKRREGMRQALGDFAPEHLATLDEAAIDRLMNDPRLIRNRAKLTAIVSNARLYLDNFPSPEAFAEFLWGFEPRDRRAPSSFAEIPTEIDESVRMARELKLRGWKFIGPTSAYAFMQSIGMVNDHLLGCLSRRNS